MIEFIIPIVRDMCVHLEAKYARDMAELGWAPHRIVYSSEKATERKRKDKKETSQTGIQSWKKIFGTGDTFEGESAKCNPIK